jgi:uncharacterized protein YbaP (TraB family)
MTFQTLQQAFDRSTAIAIELDELNKKQQKTKGKPWIELQDKKLALLEERRTVHEEIKRLSNGSITMSVDGGGMIVHPRK